MKQTEDIERLSEENEILRQRDYYKQELETICKAYGIETLTDNVSGGTIHRCKYEILASDYGRTIDKLDAENRELKDENEKLKKQLDKYLDQEEEEIRQLNNDSKLDDILESIKKANEQMAKEIKYKQALDEIEAHCNVILANRCHYSEGAILMAEKLMREYISKTKDSE